MLIFTIIYSLVVSTDQTGEIAGTIIHRDDNSNFPGIDIRLYQQNEFIAGAVSGGDGKFQIPDIPIGSYDLHFNFIGHRKKVIRNICVEPDKVLILDIVYPNSCKSSQKVCPIMHTNEVIPIKYGASDIKMKKLADDRKIFLGGCVMSDCDPVWYCKIHSVKF